MNNNPKRLFYAKTTERIIEKGTRLYSELTTSENLSAVILSDFEVGEIDGILFSLITKSAAEYQGCTPRQPQGYSYFYKSTDGVYIHDGNGTRTLEPQFIVEQGAVSEQGTILSVGDKLAAVRQRNGIVKNFLKSELKPAGMSFIDGEAVRAAQEFYQELIKSYGLHIHKPSKTPIEQRIKPKTAQPMKPLSTMMPKPKITKIPEPPAAGTRQSTQAPESKPKQGIFNKFLSGSRKVEHNIPEEQGAHEGQTKLFGVGDLRTLMRAESGQLRWMSTDEVQDELRRRAGQKAGVTGEVTHDFKVGQEINFKGQKVKVKDHAHNIIAFERQDGTTGTFKASEYKPEGQEPPQEPTKRNKITEYAQEAAQERNKREGQTRLSLVPSTEAQGETYQREAERIRTQQTNTEEYKAWRAAADEGWRDNGTFEIEKDVEYDTGEGISIKGTLRQVWNAERKTYDALFNDQSLTLSYGGKNLQLAEVEKDKLTLRDPETGESKKIDTIDLDKFNGSLKIDDDGNVSVEKAGRVLGAFQQAQGVTQEDLLSEGTIKVIRDEVWKRTQPKEGAVFNDTYLGRVTRGIAFYRHGDETGILEEGRRGHVVNRNNVRRNIQPEKMTAGLKKLQKLVINTQGQLQEEYHSTFDMNVVKAKMESGAGKSTKPVDRMKYKDVFDKFMGGGKDIQAQVSESYGKPEWSATVDSLAESFKVEDEQRAKEIEAFNSLSKSGMLKAVPEEHSTDDYREAAEELLRGKRDEYLRGKYQETAAERRAGTAKSKFEWGDTSEPPTNAKAVQQKPFKIRDSQNRSYQVSYAIVPMDSVVSSHSIEGEANPEHPTELQARKRGNPMSIQQMQKISADINDDVVQDNADATRGAPVAYSKGGKTYIVQGNGRTTGIKGTQGDQREKYFGMVLNKAKELGLPTEGITENDMLVRVMTPKHTYEDARQLAAYGQESSALPYSEVEYARAFQNAQRLPFQHGVNLEGVGNKAIDESNVGTFINKNPELYRKIVEQSGKTPEAIQAFPAEQSKIVNTALLAQLNNSFIEDIAGRDDRTHLLVKRLAPTLIDNQKQVTEGKVPEFADIQTMLQQTIKAYDSLDSGTKNAMTIKNGQSEFLTDDPKSETMNSLIHKMRQEDLMSAAGKEANIFRDPLHVIGLMAYHQAVAPKQTATAQEQSMTQYALKVRRFNEAIRSVTGEQEDIFGATQTPQEKQASQRDKILKIAEMIFLQNKAYRSGEEQLTAEEQEAAKEQYPVFDVLRKMRTAASSHGFALSGEQLSKSMKIIPRIFQNIFRTKHQKQFEIIKRIAQMELFGGNSPMEGETKSFGAKDLRRFDKMKGRWVDADEYNQTHAGTPHAGQRQEVVAHKAKKETQANLQKEPTLSKYFVMKPDTKIIPIADLEQTHEPDVEKQGRAKKHMQNASIGIIPKRNPISVVDAGKKKHVIDGNSTLEVARTLGLQQIPATVLDTIDKGRLPQFLDAYKKLEEVAGGVQQANINQLKRAALKKVYGEWRKHKTQSYPELAGKRLFRGDGYDLIFNDDGELDIVKQNHSVERQQVKLWKEYDRPKELRNKVKENKGDEAVTELMALAEKHKANFENGLKAVCKIVGVEFNQEMFDNFGTKSHESMRRKIHSAEKEQKLALYGAQYVNDALRYTFEISKWDDVQGIYDQLIGNEKETGFKILDDTVDNKFANPTDEGYRDLSMVLRVNDEITAEVQINFKALNDAKLGEGHRMYEQLRELKQKALTERSSENVSQIRAQINSIVDKSRKFYESVLNSVIGGEQAVDYSVALRKSIGNWFLRFFKTQLDIFGAKPKPQAAGIKWDKKMQEKPNHKYIRRYKGKDGEWRYVYREGEREYVGDAKGKELPKHHDWQAGDKVTHGGQEAVVHELGDKHVVLRTADNQTKTVPVEQVEHYTETQKKLLGNRAQAVEKYQSLIDEYEEDLKQGEDTNKYEFADSRAELERKIKYTKEEKAKHEKEPKKSEQLSSGVTNDEYVFTEVTNLMQSGKFPNLQSAINDYWSSNQLKLANAGYSLKKLGEAVKHEMPADQTETPEFKEWFGSSKVVDENGKPLRVFHGTAADFEAFDKKKLGTATESSDSKTGFWFSEHAKRAELAAEDAEAVSDKGYGANIMPVFLQVNNPLVYDKQIPKTPEASAKIVKDAKAEGHDGVIFTRGEGGKNYVVFKPTQIKSAVGNTGEFSPKNPSIVAETLNPYGQASLFGDNPQPIKAPKTVKRIKIGKDELLMDEIFAPESGLITETSATDRDLVSVELKKSGTLKISGRKINSPEDVAYLCRRLADSAVEKFVIVPVDKNMKPMTIDVITIGLLNSSLVHPREALRTAVELGANGIIAVHNHPSGNATPSREDETVTSQIAAAAKYAGIVFHGHVVLGSQGKYTHMDESGTMNDQGTVSNATKVETTVPIYQKEIKRSGQKPEEANAPEDLIHISRRLTGGKTGVWLLTHDSTNKVVGAHQLRENVGDYDIKSYKKIIQGIVRNNAASASIYIAIPPEEKTGLQVAEATEKSIAKRKQMKEDLVEETARSYKDMFKVLGVQFLDVLAETIGVEKGTAYGFISAAERQMMRSVGSFIMNLFKAPTHGQTKQFGISDLRKFDANRHRWIDADEWRKLNPPKIEKPTGQENLFTPDKTVEMKANDYLEEHTKLIEVLKEGDPQKLKAEAADQSKEVKEQKEKLEKEKNNVSCVMVPLSDSDELKRIQKLIPNEDIYDDDTKKFGRESWYHVTVLFGIVSNDFEAVKKLLENHKPFSVKLANKTSVFNNDLYDVIKIDVNSEGLKRMNKKLWKEFKVKTDHPDYHPHLTIAYVKKGKGKEYDGLKVNPSKFQVEQITFSDYDRWKKDFPLIKKEKEQ